MLFLCEHGKDSYPLWRGYFNGDVYIFEGTQSLEEYLYGMIGNPPLANTV